MSDSNQGLTTGWKVAIVVALLAAFSGHSGITTLRSRESDRFQNHEKRIDELENAVFGNDLGTAPRALSHSARIESLEARLDVLDAQDE